MVWPDLGLNPGLPDHWRTLYPLGQWAGFWRKPFFLVWVYSWLYHRFWMFFFKNFLMVLRYFALQILWIEATCLNVSTQVQQEVLSANISVSLMKLAINEDLWNSVLSHIYKRFAEKSSVKQNGMNFSLN